MNAKRAIARQALAQPREANVYDFPQYFDATFHDETKPEADFIEAACRKYGRQSTLRMLEPGCGGGRLVVELARRGYDMVGFDVSERALAHLRRQLARRRMAAEVFLGDMARFRLDHRVDAAFCTFSTFRHLLTDEQAASHLRCVARSLNPGGIFVLGLHLLPLDVDECCIERWRGRCGRSSVSVTLRVLATDRRRRLEWLRLSMLVRHHGPARQGQPSRWRTEFPLRMYTAAQFRRLLRQAPEFEVCDVFDYWYDIREPLKLNDHITDTVVVLKKGKQLNPVKTSKAG